jgi:cell division protein FtsQ
MKANRKRRSSSINRKKGARALKLMALAVLFGLVALGVYSAQRSRVFGVEEIVIYGNRHLSDRELMKIMGVSKGQNIFSVSSEDVASRLLASPWIRDARLRKELPGKLMVMVEEAVPEALLETGKGRFLIDGMGVKLEPLKGKPVSFLPVIVAPSGGKGRAFSSAISLARVIREAGIAAEKSRVEIRGFEKGPEEITVTIDGLRAKFGEGRYREKLARLFELSGEIKRRGIDVDYVDLRFSDRVVVKPVSTVARLGEAGGSEYGH